MKQQETHLKQQVSSLLSVLSLFCLGGFPSFPKRGTTRNSLIWKTQGQDPSWAWFW